MEKLRELLEKDRYPWFFVAIVALNVESVLVGVAAYLINSNVITLISLGFLLGQIFVIYVLTIVAAFVTNESKFQPSTNSTNG